MTGCFATVLFATEITAPNPLGAWISSPRCPPRPPSTALWYGWATNSLLFWNICQALGHSHTTSHPTMLARLLLLLAPWRGRLLTELAFAGEGAAICWGGQVDLLARPLSGLRKASWAARAVPLAGSARQVARAVLARPTIPLTTRIKGPLRVPPSLSPAARGKLALVAE